VNPEVDILTGEAGDEARRENQEFCGEIRTLKRLGFFLLRKLAA
jgi:hypothetical protein